MNDKRIRVLALEPFFGGSHRAFLEGWQAHGRHDWTILQRSARHWKWRMRQAAVDMADEVAARVASGETWDLLLCSDMLNLAEFRGLAPEPVRRLPTVAYFHENQLTYPNRIAGERDLHFGFTNFTTALAADAVWFNSVYHRDCFLEALRQMLGSMPDRRRPDLVDRIAGRAQVWPKGIDRMPNRRERSPGPPRLLWAARWEHDKNPELLFDALIRLKEKDAPFRISVLGERYDEVPDVFARAKAQLADRIDRWGWLESRTGYVNALLEADLVVSTADHEFFGVSVVEAVAAGAFPLLPRRLAYPDIFGGEQTLDFFYDGSCDDLVSRLEGLIARTEAGDLWGGNPNRGREMVEPYCWERLAPRLDDALEAVGDRFEGRMS